MHTVRAGSLRLHYNSDFSGEAFFVDCDSDESVEVSAKDFMDLAKALVEKHKHDEDT